MKYDKIEKPEGKKYNRRIHRLNELQGSRWRGKTFCSQNQDRFPNSPGKIIEEITVTRYKPTELTHEQVLKSLGIKPLSPGEQYPHYPVVEKEQITRTTVRDPYSERRL